MTVSPFSNKTMKYDFLSSYCQGGGRLICLDCWLLCMSLQEKKNTNLQMKMLFKDFNSPFTEEKKVPRFIQSYYIWFSPLLSHEEA